MIALYKQFKGSSFSDPFEQFPADVGKCVPVRINIDDAARNHRFINGRQHGNLPVQFRMFLSKGLQFSRLNKPAGGLSKNGKFRKTSRIIVFQEYSILGFILR